MGALAKARGHEGVAPEVKRGEFHGQAFWTVNGGPFWMALTIPSGTASVTGNFSRQYGEYQEPHMAVLYLVINLSSAAPVLISVPSGQLADCQQLERQVMVSPEVEST